MWIETTCRQSPLYLWLSIMIILIDVHLIVVAVENLWKKIGDESIGFNIAHGIMFSIISIWLILGHYFTFYQGLGCYENKDFLACCVLIGVLDTLSLLVLGLSFKYRIFNKMNWFQQ